MNQSDMHQDIRETLSAGIDGELSAEQLRFLLRRLDHDASLQHAWSDYHVAGDALRRQLPLLATSGFPARVLQAIEAERLQAPKAVRRGIHWLRWSAGGAIAASVAAAALMVAQPAGEADRSAVLSASVQQQPTTPTVAAVAPVSRASSPATVPPWLSGNSAGMLSEQAAATFGASLGQGQSGYAYAQRLSGYPGLHRYRTLDNNDGSYLLLLDQQQRNQPVNHPPAAAAQ